MPSQVLTQTVRLHRAQATFRRSNALYRGFVGGRGAGKSWIGAYDLIRRAKRGRTYLVGSPTGVLMQDTTYPTFTALARSLGVLGPVKLTPYPNVQLTTGAMIRFRTAEDPERMRGPNLSGVWLDEGSLMLRAAFDIVIACLREAGEMGWAASTFTPKGKKHWTYEVFGKNLEIERRNAEASAKGQAAEPLDPEVELVHARTENNPFLPKGFGQRLRKQYTSAQSSQEVDGQFTDAAGVLFRREWFGVVDVLPPLRRQLRAWDLAATPKNEKKANDPDWPTGVRIGETQDGLFVVTDVRRIRGTPREVQRLVRTTAEQDGHGVPIYMEQEPGSAGVFVVDDFLRLLAGFTFHGERSSGNKADRARPLAAQAEGGNVQLLRAGWNKDFLDEVECFPFVDHDDQVDAASLALAKLTQGEKSYLDPAAVQRAVQPAGKMIF